MKRNNTLRSIIVVLIVAWAVYEMQPPTARPVVDVFEELATAPTADFQAIVKTARETDNPTNSLSESYRNLRAAVGTNQLERFFSFDTKGEREPNRAILNRIQRESAGKFKLGLDLQGGCSVLVQMSSNKVAAVSDTASLQQQAIEVLRLRLDKFGVAEPIIRADGEDRILIQMPGLSNDDLTNIVVTVTKPAVLEFRMVHPRSDELIARGELAPGYVTVSEAITGEDGSITRKQMLVKVKPERGLTGKYVKDAYVDRNPTTMQPEIGFEFDSEGTKIFRDVTTDHTGQQMAIVLDGELYSAPVIREVIGAGRGSISGDFNFKEANELAQVLENPLETKLNVLEVELIGASLGQDSVNSGKNAAIYGVVAVAIFMIIYYMVSGVLATIALSLNMVILLGVMCSIDATFTLPGIAGIVLTIGMAVDANVLIYERIREELFAGKSLRGSVNAGYDKAWGTIFDSNVTTLIVSTILIYLGSGPVKGFGVTLTIGVCASMFTAMIVTRILFDYMLERDILKKLSMRSVVGQSKIDFLQFAKPAAIGSVIILLIGLGVGIIGKGKQALGVDFVGGDAMTYKFASRVDTGKVREALAKVSYTVRNEAEQTVGGDILVQYQSGLGDGGATAERLRVTTPIDSGVAVTAALEKAFPDAKFEELSKRQVGAVIGAEILKSAIQALVLALFGILFYVGLRFEFSFSVAAVIAVIHDFVVTLGIYILIGGQVSAPIIAALLTVIGFSINDTIVIFDRIREDLKLGIRGTFKEVINKALNQTLARTIITSGTTLIAVLSLAVFGGGAINDFAITLLIGVVVGTYSSIYVASATVLWWHKGERPKMSNPEVSMGVASAETA
ncbi:MAG: protein translocase subunit SecD [Limisphaerales bacterium]